MVQDARTLRVGRVVELEAAVEAVAVDDVGADPAAHPVGALQHGDLDTAAGEVSRGGKTAQSGSHDHDGHGRYGKAPPDRLVDCHAGAVFASFILAPLSIATAGGVAVLASVATVGSAAVAGSVGTVGSAAVAGSVGTVGSAAVAGSIGTLGSAAVAGSIGTALSVAMAGCIACVACLSCRRCRACVACSQCEDCVGCVGCHNCSGLRNAVGLRDVHVPVAA